jgi:hypothetical protein
VNTNLQEFRNLHSLNLLLVDRECYKIYHNMTTEIRSGEEKPFHSASHKQDKSCTSHLYTSVAGMVCHHLLDGNKTVASPFPMKSDHIDESLAKDSCPVQSWLVHAELCVLLT